MFLYLYIQNKTVWSNVIKMFSRIKNKHFKYNGRPASQSMVNDPINIII